MISSGNRERWCSTRQIGQWALSSGNSHRRSDWANGSQSTRLSIRMAQRREKQVQLGSPENRKKLHELGELLSEATGVARNLSRGLHPVTLNAQGLPAALAELAARVPHHVNFSWPHSARLELEHAVALHVYRIAEEA